ncbi:MAG: hypothetical protein HYT16_03285 [DPANN group archaeon]|nr:hypothetical protein [DPANN group archaeon]
MKTTIQLDKSTLIKLKRIRLSKRESYNELINRLLKLYKQKEWFKLRI